MSISLTPLTFFLIVVSLFQRPVLLIVFCQLFIGRPMVIQQVGRFSCSYQFIVSYILKYVDKFNLDFWGQFR